LKNKALNKTLLKKINEIAHSNSFKKKLSNLNNKYADFEKFIEDYEILISGIIEIPSESLSTQDKIFEGIINRLDVLSNHKNLTLKIYLEAQKNPKYFLIINKFINIFFKSFIKSRIDMAKAYFIYIYAFNVWIEDNKNMDKTMAAIGNSFESLNKFQSFIKK
tara:strand:- start:4945 stop:5433 length:489 start_codon:yes stop_codon:yes gene_type:complete